MKRFTMIMIAVLLCLMGSTAVAESGRIDDNLFNSAKQTLFCIDTGDYRTASALLGCVDIDTLRTFVAQNFTTLGYGTAQTYISVAFSYNGLWYLAVPTQEPAFAEVEALVLSCGNGTHFQAVNFACWGDVQNALDYSEAVIWNEEYSPGVYLIME